MDWSILAGLNEHSIEVYDTDSDTWTLLKNKLDGEVVFSGACIS